NKSAARRVARNYAASRLCTAKGIESNEANGKSDDYATLARIGAHQHNGGDPCCWHGADRHAAQRHLAESRCPAYGRSHRSTHAAGERAADPAPGGNEHLGSRLYRG